MDSQHNTDSLTLPDATAPRLNMRNGHVYFIENDRRPLKTGGFLTRIDIIAQVRAMVPGEYIVETPQHGWFSVSAEQLARAGLHDLPVLMTGYNLAQAHHDEAILLSEAMQLSTQPPQTIRERNFMQRSDTELAR